MPKLTVCKGLPGSGKTTWALDQMRLTGNTVRVNRDDLRAMLYGGAKWSSGQEKLTVDVEKRIVARILLSGQNVIVDDTNLLGSGTQKWEQFATSDAKVEIEDFTERVTIDECIRRDSLRSGKARVGRGVIERMALQAGLIDLSGLDKVAIVDIDGTLANLDHRLHYIQQTPKDHEGFFAHVSYDKPFMSIAHAVVELALQSYRVIILSGRPSTVGYETNEWLLDLGLPFYHLFMRRGGDHRPDDQVKREIMEMMFTAGLRKDAIKVVLDDRDSVCAVWREMNLPLIQVDHGAAIQIHPDALQIAIDCKIPVNGDGILRAEN